MSISILIGRILNRCFDFSHVSNDLRPQIDLFAYWLNFPWTNWYFRVRIEYSVNKLIIRVRIEFYVHKLHFTFSNKNVPVKIRFSVHEFTFSSTIWIFIALIERKLFQTYHKSTFLFTNFVQFPLNERKNECVSPELGCLVAPSIIYCTT